MSHSSFIPVLALATLLAGSIPGSFAAAPSWYKCNCPADGGGKDCVCPSTEPPGGLDPADTPQFVLFTHDDAITPTTYQLLQSVLGGKRAHGCPLVATMFTLWTGDDCNSTKNLYNQGYEIADHTLHHLDMDGMLESQVVTEVVGARDNLASQCGVPAADIVGFRQPYLASSPTVRQVLYDNGFLYDGTILEEPTGSSLSEGMAARVWPYTLQDGVPQDCAWFAPAQTCNQDERYPGMWEVPLWDVNAFGLYSMDYGDSDHPALEVLKANFDAAYGGNRAPMPVFIHTPWLQANERAAADFVDYALSKPGVYFLTVRQLLAWMTNPVPLSQLTPQALGCGNAGGAPPANNTAATAEPSPSPSPSPAPEEDPSASPSPFVPAPHISVNSLYAPNQASALALAPAPAPWDSDIATPAPAPSQGADFDAATPQAVRDLALAPDAAPLPLAAAPGSGSLARAAASSAAAAAAVTVALLLML